MKLTWDQVLAWRMRQQLLDRPKGVNAVETVKRLCGVQAQVASSADQAVAVRQATPRKGDTSKALDSRELIKTWAMRGTLHLLAAEDAAAYLSLMAAPKTWEKASWQKTFATAKQVQAIAEAAQEALDNKILTREQLGAQIARHTGDDSLTEKLSSGWGALLKPLAWQGYLCNGPNEGNKITFTGPRTWIKGWKGLPEPDEAAATVIPAYLGAYGPATPEVFDQWLIRGASKKAALKGWFKSLVEAGELVEVNVEGMSAYARAADVDNIASAKPMNDVRLLPAFDQFVLGPGTKDEQIISPKRRSAISKTAGWISPVVVANGRVAGTWEAGDHFDIILFKEAGKVPEKELAAEASRMAKLTGSSPEIKVQVV
jgi:hypothetical protein